ncbi:MAG: glycosyltransferase family 2 protein [Gemmataceae bacterium]
MNPASSPLRIAIIIPVFNEEDSLQALHTEIRAATRNLAADVQVLFVDDGSRDQSWPTICRLATQDPRTRGIRFRKNFGKAAALAIGFATITGDVVFTLDADLQDDPKEIPRFLERIRAGADVVSGWKKIRHDPWHKVFPSRVFNTMVSAATGVHLHDHNCGFKAYRGNVPQQLHLYGELHRFTPVLAAAQGFRIEELVIEHRPRVFGQSKFGPRRFLKGFLDLVSVSFRTRFGESPMHFFGALALLNGILVFVGLISLVLSWRYAELCILLGTILATQFLLAGWLAELLISQRPPESTHRILETTPTP